MSSSPGMKNQYFGDINDYRKYGLLRLLAGAGLSVGVCWLLTPNDGGVDGERRSYLLKPGRWRKHNPNLYDLLRPLLRSGAERSWITTDVLEADHGPSTDTSRAHASNTPGFWMNLQLRWDLYQAQQTEAEALQRIRPIERAG